VDEVRLDMVLKLLKSESFDRQMNAVGELDSLSVQVSHNYRHFVSFYLCALMCSIL